MNKRLVLLNPRKSDRKRKSKKSRKKSPGHHAQGSGENYDPNTGAHEMESEETALVLSEEASSKKTHAQSMPVLPELTERPGRAGGSQNEQRGDEPEINDMKQF